MDFVIDEIVKNIESRIEELKHLILLESDVIKQELYRSTLRSNIEMLKFLKK